MTTAAEPAEEALTIHRRTGHRLGEARTLMSLGMRQQARAIFSEVGVDPEHSINDDVR